MNIKLEDFVKEYICTEQDIHIEEMQASVMEYGRMQRKIEDTCREIRTPKGHLRPVRGRGGLPKTAGRDSGLLRGEAGAPLPLRQAVSESGQ